MYAASLLLHSWMRYFVLAAGLWLLIAAARGLRASVWSAGDEKAHKIFLGLLDTQFLLGLLLYFVLSPLTAAAMGDMGAAMKNPVLRFYGVEHIATMFLAVAAAHIGRTRSKKKTEARARYKTTLIAQIVWLLLTLVAIPWPMLDVGRPLFRF